MRGGMSNIVTRFAQTSKAKYNDDTSDQLIYLDANNLYGWAMSQPLPTGGFKVFHLCQVAHLAHLINKA